MLTPFGNNPLAMLSTDFLIKALIQSRQRILMLVPNSQYHKRTGPNMMELMAVSNLKVAGSALRHVKPSVYNALP